MKIEETKIIESEDYRVIIFPASRSLSAKESKTISEKLYDFLYNWTAHGKPLSASFKIEKNQFIIIVIDEEKESASGCSIDSLNGLMKEIDQKFQLGLFDRMKACFLENNEIKTMKLSDFRKAVKSGDISHDIEVFDFSKDTYLQFLTEFQLPLKKSWARVLLS